MPVEAVFCIQITGCNSKLAENAVALVVPTSVSLM